MIGKLTELCTVHSWMPGVRVCLRMCRMSSLLVVSQYSSAYHKGSCALCHIGYKLMLACMQSAMLVGQTLRLPISSGAAPYGISAEC